MTGEVWVDTLIIAAAVLTALVTIWRLLIRPAYHTLNTAVEAIPVLVGIAEEFQPNSGTTLRDVIEKMGSDISGMHADISSIREAQFALQTQVRTARSAAEAAAGVAERGVEEIKTAMAEQQESQARTEPIIADTHRQVTTLNGASLAELGDASETRRIGEKADADVTEAEAEHIAIIPPPDDGDG